MTMAHLPLLGSPLPLLLIVTGYLLFTLKIGPAYMRTRPAYTLRTVLQIYNTFQVVLNYYFFFSTVYVHTTKNVYDIGCMMPTQPNHSAHKQELMFCYIYYLIKIFDFLDTIFFVLRKNQRQVTFLHVYHHVFMATFSYIFIRFGFCGGHVSCMGILNSFVHGCMYIYYLLSSFSDRIKGALWWKKYITSLQIAQFAFLWCHSLWPMVMRSDCQYPRAILLLVMAECMHMMYLFVTFYIKTYIKCDQTSNSTVILQKSNATTKQHEP